MKKFDKDRAVAKISKVLFGITPADLSEQQADRMAQAAARECVETFLILLEGEVRT